MEYLKSLYYGTVIPTLYMVVMWACLSVAASLFVGSFLKGIGIVSAVSLYYIIKAQYFKELREGMVEHVEPDKPL